MNGSSQAIHCLSRFQATGEARRDSWCCARLLPFPTRHWDPHLGATEVWEIFNFTADAHPIHIHMVTFEVVNRQQLQTDDEGITLPPARLVGEPRLPEPWESGRKDTVIVYPGEVARVKAVFDIAGLYVWHCHIVSHEDNEMMRPYRVVPSP